MSSIAVTKKVMGYDTAARRPRCGTCAHRGADHPERRVGMDIYCSEGGFLTSAWAICDRYEPIPKPSGETK